MSAPRVVVIVHDDWILHLLQDGLREGGFVVATASTAEDGAARVRELSPDCVLCDVALPDKDGYAVTASLRGQSIVPIALLAPEEDATAKTAAFEAGADALLTRPFRLEEVVAQMNALVQLARRMRERRTSLIDSLGAGPPSSPEGASFRGELEHMPLASLLTLLELERKTGTVSLRSGRRGTKLELAEGHIVSASIDSIQGEIVPILREALAFESGEITFRAKPQTPRPSGTRPIRALLAEARGPSRPAAVHPHAPARGQAIPPPPGHRKTLETPKIEVPKPVEGPEPTTQPLAEHTDLEPPPEPEPPPPAATAPNPKKPALGDIPTRRVHVPEHAPRPQPVHDKVEDEPEPTAVPPSTRRP